MLNQLFFANLHFTIKVLAALIFFATGWLHYVSWKLKKKEKILLVRSFGFFLLSAMSAGQATSIGLPMFVLFLQAIKILGLVTILISLINEPTLHPPKKEAAAVLLLLITESLVPISAVLYLVVAITYLRKSTEGYEKQIKPMFFAFLFLSLSEFINISFFAKDSQVVFWSNLLADFGPTWIASRIFELLGIIIMGIWTWGYIRFRAQAQLFIIFVTSSLLIFTITTFSFTFLLLKNLERNALDHLKTDVKVLQYAVDRLKSEALADAKVVAENSVIKDAIVSGNSEKLYKTTLEFMLSQNTSFLETTNGAGKVVMRASDKEKIGDNLSEDLVVKSALNGNPLSSVTSKDVVVTPVVQIRASSPVFKNNSVAGVIITGFSVDGAFVDGVKEVTGLDASVFAGDTRAATTFVSPDGKSRFIGTKEVNDDVLSKVLEDGEVFIGPARVLNQPFYTAYSPLKTAGDEIIGMLFVGKLQTELFATAERSIQLTFLGSIILMLLSIPPAYLVSKYIKENLQA